MLVYVEAPIQLWAVLLSCDIHFYRLRGIDLLCLSCLLGQDLRLVWRGCIEMPVGWRRRLPRCTIDIFRLNEIGGHFF